MATVEDLRNMTDTILQDDTDIILNVPLKDLVWTIVCYSQEMSNLEQEAFGKTYPYLQPGMTQEQVDYLIDQREYTACRRDELARIIGQYTSFDTQRIYKEVDKLFKKYDCRGVTFE